MSLAGSRVDGAPTPADAPVATVSMRRKADLERLLRAVRGEAAARRGVQLIDALCPALEDRSLLDPPLWSGVCDDCSPYEFSVAFSQGKPPEVRLLLEAQSSDPSPYSYWQRGNSFAQQLARFAGASIAPLRQVVDLFTPTHAEAFFSSYHAIEFREESPTSKVYLNPHAQNHQCWRTTLREAAQRFRLSAQLERLMDELPNDASVVLLSLDLVEQRPRFKVYVRLFDVDGDELERLSRACSPRNAEVASEIVRQRRFFETLIAPEGSCSRRAIFAVFHLDERVECAKRVVVDVPLLPYVASDEEARSRISRMLLINGIDSQPYEAALQSFGQGPLDQNIGLHSYCSYQHDQGRPRLTVYFNPLLYASKFGFSALAPPKDFWQAPVDKVTP